MSCSDASDGVHLRLEARRLKLEELTPDLHEAGASVVKMLADALDHSADEVHERRSRLVFVDAERGCGKSTLWQSLCLSFACSAPSTPGGRSDDIETMLNNISNMRGQVHWLAGLDLDPGPKDFNPLAALLVRIEAALRPVCDRPSGREALNQLEHLSCRVVPSWTGALVGRLSNLDPDGQSQEVMEVERQRLDINHRLNEMLEKALHALQGGQAWGKSRKGLFVLPVDDFDLNPQAATELLRLIRAISVPRLFVILHGNYEMLLRLVDETKLMDDGTPNQPNENPAVRALSREIGAQALRKHLPPSQQVRIQRMSPERALEFCPPQSLETKRLIDQIPQSIKEMLTHRDSEIIKIYQGLSSFRLPVRHVYDLWILARRVERPASAETTDRDAPPADHQPTTHLGRKFVEPLARALIREDSSVDNRCEQILFRALDIMRRESVGQIPDGITLKPNVGRTVRLTDLEGKCGNEKGIILVNNGHCDLIIGKKSSLRNGLNSSRYKELVTDEGIRKNEGLIGSLVLLHDLVLEQEPAEVGTWLDEDASCAWTLMESGSKNVKLPWAPHVWHKIRHFDLFRSCWNVGLNNINNCQRSMSAPDDKDLAVIAFVYWIHSSFFVFSREGIFGKEVQILPLHVAPHDDLNQIKNNLQNDKSENVLINLLKSSAQTFARKNVANENDSKYQLILRWLTQFILLLDPVMSISNDGRNEVGLSNDHIQNCIREGFKAGIEAAKDEESDRYRLEVELLDTLRRLVKRAQNNRRQRYKFSDPLPKDLDIFNNEPSRDS